MENLEDYKAFRLAYAEVPKGTSLPHTDEECYDVYFSTLEIVERSAPVTAALIRDLWMEPNPYITGNPPIRDVAWGMEYLRLKAEEAGVNVNGRPASAAVENAEALLARQRARDRKQEAKAESKAAYEARLAKYARRRTAIAEAEAETVRIVAERDLAVLDARKKFDDFVKQCDEYVATQKQHVKDLKAIHADNWPY